MNYRREIDGLRAFSVLSVILFHFGFEAFSGGFVGVDVFFVISGYLITTIILDELAQGNFSIINFYERRARRILPALFLVMLVCIPFSVLLLPPSELVSFSKSLVAVSLFTSNFFFWRGGGYFETAAELKPLLHTWSLAVEEQYYILFPLFLTLLRRLSVRRVLILLIVFFTASLAIAQWGALVRPMAAFFLLPTRGWELLMGAFAAFYLSKLNCSESSRSISEVGGWLGLILILYTVFFYSKATLFPGLNALVPTVGAVLIILFATKKTYIGRFLSNKCFVAIGLISYSAYLLHQPLLAYARYWNPEIGLLTKVFLIITVFALSILNWKFIEEPFRRKGRFGRRFIFLSALIGCFFFVLVGLLVAKFDYRREEVMAKELSTNPAVYVSNIDERKFIKSRIEYEQSTPKLVVLGSSRVMQIGNRTVGSDVLNLAVSGASVEDDVAIWYLASKKFNPKLVIIGADPWLFNGNSGQNEWASLKSEYFIALKELGFDIQTQNQSTSTSTLTNWYSDNFFVHIYNAVNLSKIKALDDSPSVLSKIRRDGSRVYDLLYANKSSGEVDRGVGGYLSYMMSDYSYSNEAKNIFEKLVSSIAIEHEVLIVLSPYHPKLYELMKRKDKKILGIEKNFDEISRRLGVKLIGSYDPVKVGCGDDEFFDGMHPKESCMRKVMAQFFP